MISLCSLRLQPVLTQKLNMKLWFLPHKLVLLLPHMLIFVFNYSHICSFLFLITYCHTAQFIFGQNPYKAQQTTIYIFVCLIFSFFPLNMRPLFLYLLGFLCFPILPIIFYKWAQGRALNTQISRTVQVSSSSCKS